MLQRLRVVPVPQPAVFRNGFRLEEVTGRVRDLDRELDPDSPAFRAALLLLSAAELGQNIYKLALTTKLDTRFVSRCARHLIDNGVWVDGITLAGWEDAEAGRPAFWADVQVSLGHATRRVDDDGFLRWAPAGEWWKRFDYGSPEFDDAGVTYELPVVPDVESGSVEGVGLAAEVAGDEDSIGDAWREGAAESAAAHVAGPDWIGLSPDESGRLGGTGEVAHRALPVAIWLG